MSKVYILIPARRGSKGLPFKNRTLLDDTLKIIPNAYLPWTYISTDDSEIIKMCKKRNINFVKRSPTTSGDTASTKSVLVEFMKRMKIGYNDTIITLYLTYPERTWADVQAALTFFNKKGANSLLCKKEVDTHPYLCMFEKGDKGKQVIPHSLYRRQDYPKCFEISHYISIVNVNHLNKVNYNLYNMETVYFPIGKVIDVDTPDDLAKVNKNQEKVEVKITDKPRSFDPNRRRITKKTDLNLRYKTTRYMGLNELKNVIKNKRICLVANSTDLIDSNLGEYIDGHNFVVRFNSYKIIEKDTGIKTNIHATIWLSDYNLDVHVPIRVIFSGSKANWNQAIKNKKLKQNYILKSNWPMREKMITSYSNGNCPTTGFNMLLLLVHLSGYSELNLIGFNQYKDGKSSQMSLATYGKISEVHDYKFERQWILRNCKSYDKETNIITF